MDTRPWGFFEVIYQDDDVWLKRLIINPGQALSLQLHNNRTEYWIALHDGVKAIIGDLEVSLITDKVYCVPARVQHRLINPTDSQVEITEWAIGRPEESDIIRIEDKYNRV